MQNDKVLNQLLIKKKELLNDMLRQSQLLQIRNGDQEMQQLIEEKQQTYENLLKNDAFIKLRELETGIDSLHLDQHLTREIGFIMQSIQENNSAVIGRFEQEKTGLETEKNQLTRSRRLSGYIQHNKQTPYNSRMTPQAARKPLTSNLERFS